MYDFNVFKVFFSKSQKHDFLRFFELFHTFSPTLVAVWVNVSSGIGLYPGCPGSKAVKRSLLLL